MSALTGNLVILNELNFKNIRSILTFVTSVRHFLLKRTIFNEKDIKFNTPVAKRDYGVEIHG